MSMPGRYRMKCVLFDTISDCTELRKQLYQNQIVCDTVVFGLEEEQSLCKAMNRLQVFPKDTLLITNSKSHAEAAASLGIACVGTTEGLCELPKVNTLLEDPEEVSIDYLDMLYCHERKIPAIIAETEHCYLKEMTETDFSALFHIYQKPEVAKYLSEPMKNEKEELDKFKAYVTWTYSFFGYGYWGVYEQNSHRFIGRAGYEVGSEPLEAGYLLDSFVWGKGYGTEILSALIQYADQELGIPTMMVRIHRNNIASFRVAEKCGMVQIGTDTTGELLLYQYKKSKTQETVPA